MAFRHAHKFRLGTDASRDTRCSRALNTQLLRVIAERAIQHVRVMDGWSFGQSQWNFLLTSLITPTDYKNYKYIELVAIC